MTTPVSETSSHATALVLVAMVLAVLGALFNILYFSGAFLCLGSALIRQPRSKAAGYSMVAFAVLFFLAVFAYGIGKDLAYRDNALECAGAGN